MISGLILMAYAVNFLEVDFLNSCDDDAIRRVDAVQPVREELRWRCFPITAAHRDAAKVGDSRTVTFCRTESDMKCMRMMP